MAGNSFVKETAENRQVVFPVGSYLECETCFGDKVNGEVLGHDGGAKVLALKTTSTGKSFVHIVNLSLLSNCAILSEASSESNAQTAVVNLAKVKQRLESELKKKSRSIPNVAITPYGQQVFLGIGKTLDGISWENDCIVVDSVIVKPPYSVENVGLRSQYDSNDQKHLAALEHVKKLVERISSSTQPAPSEPTAQLKEPEKVDHSAPNNNRMQPPPRTSDSSYSAIASLPARDKRTEAANDPNLKRGFDKRTTKS